MHLKLMSKFYSLAEKAKEDPKSGCEQRAEELADTVLDLGIESSNVYILSIETSLRPRKFKRSIKWDVHYVILLDGIVFDPSLGEPVAVDKYLQAAYSNHKKIKNNATIYSKREISKTGYLGWKDISDMCELNAVASSSIKN